VSRTTEAYTHPVSGAKIPARQIVDVPVSELAQYRWDTVARTRAKKGSAGNTYEQTKAHVAEHGIQSPLLLGDKQGAVSLYDGHHRLLAAEELGLPTVPVALHESLGERVGQFHFGKMGA
jgi:ParB-like chromosome segregation protein Spo0J